MVRTTACTREGAGSPVTGVASTPPRNTHRPARDSATSCGSRASSAVAPRSDGGHANWRGASQPSRSAESAEIARARWAAVRSFSVAALCGLTGYLLATAEPVTGTAVYVALLAGAGVSAGFWLVRTEV